MHGGLRMHHHFHALRGEIEKPAGLDHLETFVHQGGGIDSDTIPHLPGRMLQRIEPASPIQSVVE